MFLTSYLIQHRGKFLLLGLTENSLEDQQHEACIIARYDCDTDQTIEAALKQCYESYSHCNEQDLFHADIFQFVLHYLFTNNEAWQPPLSLTHYITLDLHPPNVSTVHAGPWPPSGSTSKRLHHQLLFSSLIPIFFTFSKSSNHLFLGFPTYPLHSGVFLNTLFTVFPSAILCTCPGHLNIPFPIAEIIIWFSIQIYQLLIGADPQHTIFFYTLH